VVASEPVESKNESEIPESAKEASVEAAEGGNEFAVEAAPPAVEAAPVSAPVAEAVVYKTEVAIAQEAGPVDREDEPMFASANAVAETEPKAETADTLETSTPTVAPEVVESTIEPVARQEEPPVQVEESQAAVATNPAPAAPSGEPSPSAEELAEALRFLTPAQTPATPQTLAEAGAALAEELARGNGSHWIAEAVPLSPEEASGSLEAEMFRTFAPAAAEQPSSPASTASSVVAEPEVAVGEPAAEIAAEYVSTPESRQPETETSPAKQDQEGTEEPVAATTFADAVRDQEVESGSAVAQTESEATAAETHAEISSSENGPGGEEAMGKETKGKGKWHQIRSGEPVAATDAVEAAKQSEDAPKTMAAAASADGASEAGKIASIVDSVLADLRPKIVEEIAKQLAKK
jgi:hypothetical protein